MWTAAIAVLGIAAGSLVVPAEARELPAVALGQSHENPTVTPRIVNGRAPRTGEIAAYVLLDLNGSQCGGTLVDLTHIVTAGHCLVDSAGQPNVTSSQIITLWSNSGGAATSGAGGRVKSIAVHPNYDFPDNDVAVLTLVDPISGATPMPIADSETSDELLEEGEPVTSVGYGDTSWAGNLSPTMLVADLTVIPDSVCADRNKSYSLDGVTVWGLGRNTSSSVCAIGVKSGKFVDACQGDSGGPLFADGYLLGVVSGGFGCAGVDAGGPMAKPTVGGYTRLSVFRDWLSAVGVDLDAGESETSGVWNAKLSDIGTEHGKKYVDITWDPPIGLADEVESYRVMINHDWRPQRWMSLETERTKARLRGLVAGRTYTAIVQADVGDDYGMPTALRLEVPGNPVVDWVVSLGDSFISGEAGKWAGNTDALGGRDEINTSDRAYYDSQHGETIEECHRSQSALIHIGVARSMNFACSGAITISKESGGIWKPGIDAVERPDIDLGKFGPAVGQTKLLEDFARNNSVKMVVLSIGGNNFFFSRIVTDCLFAYMDRGSAGCRNDPELNDLLSPAWSSRVKVEIEVAITNIILAMRSAGYDNSEWTLVQHLYPRPIAYPKDMRYVERTVTNSRYRQYHGGCGMSDADILWADDTVLPTVNKTAKEAAAAARERFPDLRLVQMDTTDAFKGHELCNKNVYRVDSWQSEDRKGVDTWRDRDAADKSEWMKEIEISRIGDVTLEESFHPNFWGQLALRACMRELWNGGDIVGGGTCSPLQGRNARGEPAMKFELKPELTFLDPPAPPGTENLGEGGEAGEGRGLGRGR